MRKLLSRSKIWTSGRSEWALFLLLFFAAGYFNNPVEYDNTLSRYLLMSSVVDFKHLDLGFYKGMTVDIAVYDGRTYSSKAIAVPFLAAPIYWLIEHAEQFKKAGPLSGAACYLSRMWAVSLPYALAGPILYQLLLAMGIGAGDAFLAVLVYGLGTIIWIHASLFSGHATAASFALLSFASCWHLSRKRPAQLWRWWGAGLLAGLAALSEYPSGFIAVMIAVYVFVRVRAWKERIAFLAGGGACAAALMAYNNACFGSPWGISYSHLGPYYADVSTHGFFGIVWPDPLALLKLLASPARGLFFIMPVLLMAIPGFVRLFKQGKAVSAEAWIFLLIPAGMLAINAGYVVWHGGWTFGPRHLVSMMPFLVIASAFGVDRIWFAPLFLLSFMQVGLAEAVLPNVPQYTQNPIMECLLPLFRYGYQADNLGTLFGLSGIWSLLPGLAVASALAFWGWPEHGGFWKKARLNRWGWLYGAACAGIVAGFMWTRSPRETTVHGYNAKLLKDYAEERPSPRIDAAIDEEQRLRGNAPSAAEADHIRL